MVDKFKYYQVESWMIRDLEFKNLHQVVLFSIIYHFPLHTFFGARNFLAKLLLCNVRTVDRCLKYLQDIGYIKKLRTRKNYGDYKFKKTFTYLAIIDEKNHPSRKNNEEIILFDEYDNIIINPDYGQDTL